LATVPIPKEEYVEVFTELLRARGIAPFTIIEIMDEFAKKMIEAEGGMERTPSIIIKRYDED